MQWVSSFTFNDAPKISPTTFASIMIEDSTASGGILMFHEVWWSKFELSPQIKADFVSSTGKPSGFIIMLFSTVSLKYMEIHSAKTFNQSKTLI